MTIDVGRLERELMEMSAECAPGREFCEAISELAATGGLCNCATCFRGLSLTNFGRGTSKTQKLL